MPNGHAKLTKLEMENVEFMERAGIGTDAAVLAVTMARYITPAVTRDFIDNFDQAKRRLNND